MTHDQLVENGRKGGLQKGRNSAMRKTIAAEMRKYLDARLPDGRTRREALVASILGKAFEAGRMADLKLLVEILGEEVKRIDVHAVGRFVVDDADERDLYEAIADLDNYD